MRQSHVLITLSMSAVLLVGAATLSPLHEQGGPRSAMTQASSLAFAVPLDRAADATSPKTQPQITPITVAARGRVEPISEPLELAIGLVGTLSGVYVNEGDVIHKGQLLAELVNDDQRARVDEAAATVQLREAELQKLLNGARTEERQAAAAEFNQTKASLNLAEKELARRRPLVANGVESQQVLDQAISSQAVAEAKSDVSGAALALIMAPPREEDVAMARANLAVAQANLAEQRGLLDKTELHSPIDGVVLRRYLKTGETISIQPLLPILEVGDTHRLRVRAEVDESDVGRVELGQRAWITATAYPNQRFGGVVSRISPTMGRKTVGSDEPTEKHDTKILDVFIDLDAGAKLPVGLRVDVFTAQSKIAQN